MYHFKLIICVLHIEIHFFQQPQELHAELHATFVKRMTLKKQYDSLPSKLRELHLYVILLSQ